LGYTDLKNIAGIKAVLFDLDGTLMDSEPLTDLAITDLLREHQIDTSQIDFKPFHGITWQSVANGLGALFPELAAVDIAAAIQERCIQLAQQTRPTLVPGARAAFLRASACLPVAIVTGSDAETVAFFLARSQLQSACSFALSCEMYARSKPDPQSYLLAAKRLELPPTSCLVFEDSLPGLQAARAAGMLAIAIGHCAPAPPAGFAHHIIADYTLLPDDFFKQISRPL
jgi:HAD superfamily hydrolase (TIGR01509 family)